MLNKSALPLQCAFQHAFTYAADGWRREVPKEFNRAHRVADLIQRELALLVQQEVDDPRVGLVTISDATVSRDLAVSDVYFTVLPVKDTAAVEEVLNQSAGFLRTRLAKTLNIRSTPKLRFHYDNTMNTGIKLSQTIDQAIAQDRRRRAADVSVDALDEDDSLEEN